MIKSLNSASVEKPVRPVEILQFGEGNFLRAFADWAIDIANEKGVMDAGVAICKPRPRAEGQHTMIDTLREQDNLFHVCLEGVENKEPKRDARLVKCVMDSFIPDEEYSKYESYILSPELRIIISNTTEAGIKYVEGDDIFAPVPKSYPAKMTSLLYRRFKHYGGDTERGVAVVCCELIEDNGSTLREYVLRHAQANNLEQEFVDWLMESCCFCDSLVDRIVSGFPAERIDEVKREIGYDDNAVVVGELYYLWVIGGDGYDWVQHLMPLDKAGLNVIFTPSVKEFRDKKVRILNGSHTGMVAMSLLMGCESVYEAFSTPDIVTFVNKMVREEVLPMISGDRAELEAFAAGILERFYNPYIKHLLKSISLNSLSKWEARNYPTLWDNWTRLGQAAACESLTFAALMAYYSPKSGFQPDDLPDHVAYIRENWDSENLYDTITKIVSDSGIFSVDLMAITGFVPRVVGYLEHIEEYGMAATLKKFLG